MSKVLVGRPGGRSSDGGTMGVRAGRSTTPSRFILAREVKKLNARLDQAQKLADQTLADIERMLGK